MRDGPVKHRRSCKRCKMLGAFVCSGLSRLKRILVAKSAKLLKSATEKRNLKRASFTLGHDPKVGVSLVV